MRRASAEGTTPMEIEGRRLMELAVHVKLASEAVLEAARNLAKIRPPQLDPEEGAWRRTMDELIAMNVELGFMERILRAVSRNGMALPRTRSGPPVTS
jgi:hypothetical protein